RQTCGWNRGSTPFTWYRIAKELGINRPAVYRAGQALLAAGILLVQEKQLAVQTDHRLWNSDLLSPTTVAGRQLRMPWATVAGEQHSSLPGDNASVANKQPKRCQETTVFRRAKDSSKDRLKTYKDRHSTKNDDARHRMDATANTERRHL